MTSSVCFLLEGIFALSAAHRFLHCNNTVCSKTSHQRWLCLGGVTREYSLHFLFRWYTCRCNTHVWCLPRVCVARQTPRLPHYFYAYVQLNMGKVSVSSSFYSLQCKMDNFDRLIIHLTTGNPIYLISTKGARLVWPVSRGCLPLRGTWSYLRICRRSVLPYIRFCNCLLDYDYDLHIVNFAILYSKIFHSYGAITTTGEHIKK
jgi:hypothetical protein